MATNFLPVPTKRATPLPSFAQHLLNYISSHFRDTHPELFKNDVNALVAMRKELVEAKAETHPEIIKGLLKYHAQLAFIATKFPSDIGLGFAYYLPFPPPYSLTDATISLPSFTYERASVLFNIAALYASLAATERRGDAESIKRALGFLTSAAGVFNHLATVVLPVLKSEVAATGYDMTESFLTALRDFVLAEAQECYWQQAVMQGTYKNGLIAKLSMKVSEYYKSALSSANGTDTPSIGYFPPAWVNHVIVKQMHFEAAAQFRMSQEDLEKSRYGEEIARLRAAESVAKKGIDSGKGVSDTVVSDLRNLSGAIKTSLERAVRDNDLVYVAPIPPASQLSPIVGAAMVKLTTPPEVAEPVAWLTNNMAPLLSALVPYGVHLALSIYDDRKDTLVRDLDGRREELDGLAASTLQSLNLPGSIQALERPVGLPPSLVRKSEEVDSAAGKIPNLLADVNRLSKSNAALLNQALDILDQEAHENEQLLERQPHLPRQPSHIANQHLIAMSSQYDATIKQAAASDATVRAKWQEWRPMIEILEGGEGIIDDHIPSSSPTTLPPSVRPLRALLEQLDDRIANRATIVAEARQLASTDDVRPEVLQQVSRGGSDRPETFEALFEKAISKYDKLKDDMNHDASEQDRLLDEIRTQNTSFVSERQDDPKAKERERKLQEMDMAYWKWREIIDNAEEGIKFYNSLANMLHQFKEACVQFLNARRSDIGQITSQLEQVALARQAPSQSTTPMPPTSPPPSAPSPHVPAQSTPRAPAAAPAPPPSVSFSLPHPSSNQWQSGIDLLPPPPPPPILRSGGVQTQPRAAPQPAEKRVTRASMREDPIGDTQRNPYKKGTRRGGEGVI